MSGPSYDNGEGRDAMKDKSELDSIDLVQYWRILVERRNVVFICLVISVVATLLFTFSATPRYKATTTLQIERRGPNILTFRDISPVDQSWSAYSDFYQTQYRLLESQSVIRLATERLDLANNPSFISRKGTPIGRLIRWAKSRIAGTTDENNEWNNASSFIQRGISIQPIRASHLVAISFTDQDATLAADVTNAIADAYEAFSREAKFTTTEVASDFLTKQVARLQGEIDDLERHLQEYGSDKEILALSDGAQDISEQALSDLNARLSQARARRAATRARFESILETSPLSLPEILDNQLINNLKQDYADLERRHTQMSQKFKPDWPALKELTEELEQAAVRIKTESDSIFHKVRETAYTDYKQAEAEVTHLTDQVGMQKEIVKQVNRDAIEYTGLQTEINIRRNVLNELVSRQSQTETSGQLHNTDTSNIRVVDRATPPKQPVTPRKTFNLSLAVIIGLCLGVGMAFLLHYLDNTIKTEQDIERFLPGMPILAHIPLLQHLQVMHDRKGENIEDQDSTKVSTLGPDFNSHSDSRSTFAEAFKNLRTSLLLASPEHPPRWISVTSCDPNEGKSTIAINLAIVLSQMGRKVLLVDADLRRPQLNNKFGLTRKTGLSSVLSGNSDLAATIHETHVPNLQIVTSGPIPPNPSELLDSPALSALMAELEQYSFEHIVFDCPPAIQVADSLIISSKMDATIMVVRSGVTTRDALGRGATRLNQARIHLAGAVLNAIPERGKYYYYNRYRQYPQLHASEIEADHRRANQG